MLCFPLWEHFVLYCIQNDINYFSLHLLGLLFLENLHSVQTEEVNVYVQACEINLQVRVLCLLLSFGVFLIDQWQSQKCDPLKHSCCASMGVKARKQFFFKKIYFKEMFTALVISPALLKVVYFCPVGCPPAHLGKL